MSNSCGSKLVITLIGITVFYISFGFGASSVQLENDPQTLVKGDLRLSFLGTVGSKSFYVGENNTNWRNARSECTAFGMELVRTDNVAELNFTRQKSNEGYGPFWFGARDIGRREMYVWDSNSYGQPSPTADPIDDFASFYYMVDAGPMALIMHSAFGGEFIGVHSQQVWAKPYCQRK